MNAWYYAKDRHKPGQQSVSRDSWTISPLNTDHRGKCLKPNNRAYCLRFAGPSGWYLITLQAKCVRHGWPTTLASRDGTQTEVTCLACQTAHECLSCSTMIEVEPPTVELYTYPELRRFSSPTMFVQKPQYGQAMKSLQIFEYNGRWADLSSWSKRMSTCTRGRDLRIVINFEAAIGELYKGEVLKAEQLVTSSMDEIRALPSASESKILQGRAMYILSGIRRHQKRHGDAIDCILNAKKLLFGVKPGEDTAAVMYNEASVLLETGDENFQTVEKLFISSIDHCQAYDSTINMVPQRAHIRLAGLCLTSHEFTEEHGLLLLDASGFHARRIEEAAAHLAAVCQHILPLRYRIQYYIPYCDLKMLRAKFVRALTIAQRIEGMALEAGYLREAKALSLRVRYLKRLIKEERGNSRSITATILSSNSEHGPPTATATISDVTAKWPQLVYRQKEYFDIFLSCHEEDWEWFKSELQGELDELQLSICSFHRGFNYHLPWGQRLESAVNRSKLCIALISEQYVKTKRTQTELQYCLRQCQDSNKPFIPIKTASCQMSSLPAYIGKVISVLEVKNDSDWKVQLRRWLL